MSVLTPLQRDFLSSFFAQPASAPFVLTGGTALARCISTRWPPTLRAARSQILGRG